MQRVLDTCNTEDEAGDKDCVAMHFQLWASRLVIVSTDVHGWSGWEEGVRGIGNKDYSTFKWGIVFPRP